MPPRILDACGECISRWGIAKTTLDDVARQAGCSRATVYRWFPGGKEALLQALLAREITAFFAALDARLGEAGDVEAALTVGIAESLSMLRAHPALQYLLQHEAERFVSATSSPLRRVIGRGGEFAAAHLSRWLPEDVAVEVGEWVVRQILSYVSAPDERLEPSDPESVRRFVRTFLLPGVDRRAAAT